MSELNERIKVEAEAVYEQVVALRRALHANPELSNEEYETAALIERTLVGWAIAYKRLPGSTAIIAEVKGGLAGGNSVGVRADMDALPIQEETGLEYASARPGVMHACGHDVHTANLLGTAYVLSKVKDQFAGTVKLVFQPAEEIGGGAQELLDFGVLENPAVTAFLAAHVSEDLPVGQVQVKAEEVMLAFSQFTIHLSGRGGHASAPHQTDDIVLAAAKLIVELQSIPGRKINHLEPAVITVGSIHGGERGNIIPKELTLVGTIRTQNSALREEIHAHINNLLRAQEIVTGVKGVAEFRLGSGAVYNDPALTALFVQAASDAIGADKVKLARFPNNGSENFYRFAKAVPSVFFRLGVKRDAGGKPEAAHSPKFLADDAALKTGVQVTAAAALAFLREGASL